MKINVSAGPGKKASIDRSVASLSLKADGLEESQCLAELFRVITCGGTLTIAPRYPVAGRDISGFQFLGDGVGVTVTEGEE